jgi:hypothetical protein
VNRNCTPLPLSLRGGVIALLGLLTIASSLGAQTVPVPPLAAPGGARPVPGPVFEIPGFTVSFL